MPWEDLQHIDSNYRFRCDFSKTNGVGPMGLKPEDLSLIVSKQQRLKFLFLGRHSQTRVLSGPYIMRTLARGPIEGVCLTQV